MSHARKQIRDAVVQLVTGLASTSSRVYPSRLYSMNENDLPSLSIYMADRGGAEVIERVTLSTPVRYHRRFAMVIEGHAMADDNIDDVLDQLALEIETAMAAPLVVGSRTLPASLQGTEKEMAGDQERQIGVVRLTYSVAYVTAENTPGVLE